ncbi:MAG: DUF1826 domain-containing protein [Pseudomonadota bacterium]
MNLIRKIARGSAIDTGVAVTTDNLSAIHRPGCAAVIWQRQTAPSVQSWIDTLRPKHLPRARTVVRPADVREAVLQVCEASATPDCAERDWLIDDVTSLANTFAGLMRAPYLRLRFDVVTTNMCRKFHIDAVTARLICTYRGMGTQYGIVNGGVDPRRVFTVPTGAPILLRGTLWPEHPQAGLRHRSPPIEGTGETRLVMVLDPVTGADEDG